MQKAKLTTVPVDNGFIVYITLGYREEPKWVFYTKEELSDFIEDYYSEDEEDNK